MSSIPENHRKPYTEDEINYIRRHYHRKGSRWTARKLNRTEASVQYAVLAYEIPQIHDREGYATKFMSVTDAALLAGVKTGSLHQAATAWGARTPLAYGSLIDRKWAEWYARKRKEWKAAEALGWYGRNKIRELFSVASNDAAPMWARGKGKWGFAFAERVEIRYGFPKGKNKEGVLGHATYFNPWQVEDLVRDIRNLENFLTDSQRMFVMTMRMGGVPKMLRAPYNRYVFTLPESEIMVGPFPQALATWLRKRKILADSSKNWNKHMLLTQKGNDLAEELLESECRTLLPWVDEVPMIESVPLATP